MASSTLPEQTARGLFALFLEEGLTQAKIKCGRFSSPELFSVEDTITINKKPISKRCLQNLIKEIKPLCDETEKELGKAPSPFEILFVAALVYFKKEKCKKAILECGMGGIGDATNAILKSDIAVLTNIDLDHREYLGKNLVEITRNKCGILREGQKVFSALQNETSEYIIVEECKKKNAYEEELEEDEDKEDASWRSYLDDDDDDLDLGIPDSEFDDEDMEDDEEEETENEEDDFEYVSADDYYDMDDDDEDDEDDDDEDDF